MIQLSPDSSLSGTPQRYRSPKPWISDAETEEEVASPPNYKVQIAKLTKQLKSVRQKLQSKEALCSYQGNQINKISETLCALPFFDEQSMNVADGVARLSTKFHAQKMSIQAYKVELAPVREQLAMYRDQIKNLTASLEAEQCVASERGLTIHEFKGRERELYQRLDKQRATNRVTHDALMASLSELQMFRNGSLSVVHGQVVQRLPKAIELKEQPQASPRRLAPPDKGEYDIKQALRFVEDVKQGIIICELGRIRVNEKTGVVVVVDVLSPSKEKVMQHRLPIFCNSNDEMLLSCEETLSVQWFCTEMDAVLRQKGFLLKVFFQRKRDFFAFRTQIFKKRILNKSSQSMSPAVY